VQILAWVPGPWEIAIVAVIALLLFGKRLPEIGKSLGRGIVEFKKGLNDVQNEVTRPVEDTKDDQSQPPTQS
jgi:sec-independent protein translocase protein TatA